MRRGPLAVIALLACTFSSEAQAGRTHPERGRAAFADGRKLLDQGKDAQAAFRQAAKAFQEQLDVGPATAHAFLNLGNAAYLADDLPRAVWAFRSGLTLDPHHPLLRENLAYARAQVPYPAGTRGRPEPESWPTWLPRLSANTWLLDGMVAYGLAWVTLTVWWIRGGPGWATTTCCCAVLGVVAGWGWITLHRQRAQDRDTPPVVIAKDDVPLRVGNGASYPRHQEMPPLRRAMEARLLHRRGDWLQVQLGSGEVGWIRAADALLVHVPRQTRAHAAGHSASKLAG